MAWLIAQQIADELPLRVRKKGDKAKPPPPRDPVTGY